MCGVNKQIKIFITKFKTFSNMSVKIDYTFFHKLFLIISNYNIFFVDHHVEVNS
jgi:hypothetical protein